MFDRYIRLTDISLKRLSKQETVRSFTKKWSCASLKCFPQIIIVWNLCDNKKLPTSNWIFIYSPYTDILWKTLTLIESIEAFFWFFESETNEKYQNWNAQKYRNSNRDKCNHSCQIIFIRWFNWILKWILSALSWLDQILNGSTSINIDITGALFKLRI